MSALRLEAIALAWSIESHETPIFSATLCASRVLSPATYISTTAATRAQPTHWHRSITPSGKKLSGRSFGMRGVSVLTQVARLR